MFKSFEQAASGTTRPTGEMLDNLKFNAEGLLPAIAQQFDSKDVLMMAWMNRTALEETLTTGRVCYYSRSRQQLWRKGEASGHVQHLVAMRVDCDGDTLLLLVNQTGPACHTNRPSCFYLQLDKNKITVLQDNPDAR